jgi:hypothetical protein
VLCGKPIPSGIRVDHIAAEILGVFKWLKAFEFKTDKVIPFARLTDGTVDFIQSLEIV